MHALHHDDRLGTVIPVHLRHQQERRLLEIAPQLTTVGSLSHQVELVVQVFIKLCNNLARPQTPTIFRPTMYPRSDDAHQRDITFDRSQNTRTQHLDRDLGTILQCREMYLRHRGGCHRLALEAAE